MKEVGAETESAQFYRVQHASSTTTTPEQIEETTAFQVTGQDECDKIIDSIVRENIQNTSQNFTLEYVKTMMTTIQHMKELEMGMMAEMQELKI